MTTVTVTDGKTPSQQIIEDANRVVEVRDARGRTIAFKRITMSIRRRVFKNISAENSEKEKYLGLAMLAASVVSIDGENVKFPTNELQFDALIDRLEDDGFTAISIGHVENFNTKGEDSAGE